ncbi:MAG: hypothetical protein IJX28_08535 [Clostridia bacterium]|nr:hypothetical protein [Clostridia bacterium]
MNYQAYEEKMQRIAQRIQWVRRYRYLLLAGGIALLALCATLLLLQGALLSDASAPEEPLVYGSPTSFRANAFLGRVTFEYRVAGEGEAWSTELPRLPGNYLARAVSHRTFGRVTYGAELAFSILPAPLEVRAEDRVVYGDTPKGVANGLQYGDRLETCSVLLGEEHDMRIPTDVDLASVRVVNAQGEDVTSAYAITVASQSVTVLPRPITITMASAEKVYDGKALTAMGHQITAGSLTNGDTVKLTVEVSLTNVVAGGVENAPTSVRIRSSRGEDYTSRYEITVVAGRLTVLPRPITIATGSAEKIYDGIELTSLEYTLVEGSLVAGHIEYMVEICTLLTAGSMENRPVFEIITTGGGIDRTSNYEITYQCGTLTVHPRPVRIRASSYTWFYDGNLHQGDHLSPKFTLEWGDGFYTLATGDTLTCDATSGLDLVSEVHNRLSNPRVTNGAGQDVTSSYTFTLEDGLLKVVPCPITVAAPNKQWEYTGQTEAASGEVFPVFGYPDGSLPKLENGDVTDTQASNLPQVVLGTFRALYKPSTFPVDVGAYSYTPVNIQIQNLNLQNKDVTSYFEIYTKDGTFTVQPRNILITTASTSFVYDGQAHYDPNYTVVHLKSGNQKPDGTWSTDTTVSALCVAHSLELINYVSITDAGKIENRPSQAIITDHTGRDVTFNYNILYECGEIWVVPRPLYLEPCDVSLIYNGSTQHPSSAEGYYRIVDMDNGSGGVARAISFNGLVLDHRISKVSTRGSLLNVGECDFSLLNATVCDGNGRDVTHNYDVTFVNNIAVLTILPRPITITTESDEKFFDGDMLCGETFWVSQGSLATGHTLDGKAWGEQLGIGNTHTRLEWYEIYDAVGTQVTYNYDVTVVAGELLVKERPDRPLVEIRPYHIQKTYTGELVSCGNTEFWIAEGREFLPEGYRIETEIRGSYWDIGNWDTALLWIRIYDGDGNDITAQFNVKAPYGTISIVPIRLVVSSKSAEKIFDGTPLTNPEYLITFGRLLEGHSLQVQVSGEQTEVGSSQNGFLVTGIVDANGNDVTQYYDVELKPGTLTVLSDPNADPNVEIVIPEYPNLPWLDADVDDLGTDYPTLEDDPILEEDADDVTTTIPDSTVDEPVTEE